MLQVIAVDLARRLLRSPDQKNMLAMVVSTENITQNWYRGNDRSMLLSNCLFRCGAAALLLSNRNRDARRARFKLLHIVRTHMGKDDDCYKSVFQVRQVSTPSGWPLKGPTLSRAWRTSSQSVTCTKLLATSSSVLVFA
ncbi:MAG: hypothetical protein SGPRY_003666 [Prymnesium sp.]